MASGTAAAAAAIAVLLLLLLYSAGGAGTLDKGRLSSRSGGGRGGGESVKILGGRYGSEDVWAVCSDSRTVNTPCPAWPSLVYGRVLKDRP